MANDRGLTLELLPDTFAVAQLAPDSDVPDWVAGSPLVSITRSPAELSITCTNASVPPNIKAQRGFRCLRVVGPLDFTEVGVVSSLARPLANAAISIFVFSTYDTDYLLFAETQLERSVSVLSDAGHTVRRWVAA